MSHYTLLSQKACGLYSGRADIAGQANVVIVLTDGEATEETPAVGTHYITLWRHHITLWRHGIETLFLLPNLCKGNLALARNTTGMISIPHCRPFVRGISRSPSMFLLLLSLRRYWKTIEMPVIRGALNLCRIQMSRKSQYLVHNRQYRSGTTRHKPIQRSQ